MKSITTTKQELKELLEKGFFERVEPVKKGEVLEQFIYGAILSNTKEVICSVGEVFSVKNKKGGFAWTSKSNSISFIKDNKPFPKFKNAGWKPFLVQLDKIESEEQFDNVKSEVIGIDEKKVRIYGEKMIKPNWIKTFRRD